MATYRIAGKRVFVAGHQGMVGAALVRRLQSEDCEILVAAREALDLRDGAATGAWFDRERPDTVFVAAGTVGGILANQTAPVDFLYDNLLIGANVIEAAHRTGVGKLLYLGSSCIYPRDAAQPIGEAALLSGPLDPSNEPYAIAKIAGLKLAQAYRRQHGADFIAAMPTNLYGPGDNFDQLTSHVLPALMGRIHEAHATGQGGVTVWGTGTPRREFLHVDDLAGACIFLMQHYSHIDPINVGSGQDMTIAALAGRIAAEIGFDGEIRFDLSKPDGPPRKLLDVSRLTALGWTPSISLKDGISSTYQWFAENAASPATRLS